MVIFVHKIWNILGYVHLCYFCEVTFYGDVQVVSNRTIKTHLQTKLTFCTARAEYRYELLRILDTQWNNFAGYTSSLQVGNVRFKKIYFQVFAFDCSAKLQWLEWKTLCILGFLLPTLCDRFISSICHLKLTALTLFFCACSGFTKQRIFAFFAHNSFNNKVIKKL